MHTSERTRTFEKKQAESATSDLGELKSLAEIKGKKKIEKNLFKKLERNFHGKF